MSRLNSRPGAQKSSKTVAVVCSFFVLFSAGLAFYTFSLWQKQQRLLIPSIPNSVSSKILFKPYVPIKLPGDFAIDSSSYSEKDGALLFSARNSSNEVIGFSEQTSPKDFDYSQFYKNNFISPIRLTNVAHTSIFGKIKNRNNGLLSVVTNDNTWILVTLPDNSSQGDASWIAQHLQPRD